jgi:hypothetical protein
MKRKKIYIGFISTVMIVLGMFALSYYFSYNNGEDDIRASELRPMSSSSNNTVNKKNNNSTMTVASEIVVTNEQLIDMSDIIVKGKIIKALGKYDLELDYFGETALIERVNYEFELSEVLKGEKIKNITISCTGGFLPNGIELNNEYVLCLTHIQGDYKDAYSFVSPSQGSFEVVSDEMKSSFRKIKVDDFKKDIKAVIEKNNKGIEIKSPIPGK